MASTVQPPVLKGRERALINKSYSIENGYPGRRRSIVDDAKFETLVHKMTKQSWIEEVRKSISEDLGDDELLLKAEMAEEPELAKVQEKLSLLISLKEGIFLLAPILESVKTFKGVVTHVESRPVKGKTTEYDILLKLEIDRENLILLLKTIRQNASVAQVSILSEKPLGLKETWYPRHISELDLCNHLMTKFEPDLDHGHPGFTDKTYRARRKEISDIAFTYKHGEPVPRIQYTPEELKTWGIVFEQVVSLIPTHACQQYRAIFELLQKEVGYRADNIPQLEDISNFLKRKTGFSVRPAAGLLSARDFLASLAFRVFQSTQYIRHASSPNHSPEPDCIHELIGHIPMLADPDFALFSQELGLASLGAPDEDIEKFATMYWFSIEFGLVKENGVTKAYGAGLLSSYGELLHALSDKPKLLPFDPAVCAVQPYQDQDYQDIYFVAESLEEVQTKFRRWVKESITRPYEVRYDPFTQTVEILDTTESLANTVRQVHCDVTHVQAALKKMKLA